MAKLVTVVQTYFSDGTYRNNQVEIQIPDEAGELIRKFWNEKGVHKCVKAKFLASNQLATAELFQNETTLSGIKGMFAEETDETEVFKHSFAGDENEADEED